MSLDDTGSSTPNFCLLEKLRNELLERARRDRKALKAQLKCPASTSTPLLPGSGHMISCIWHVTDGAGAEHEGGNPLFSKLLRTLKDKKRIGVCQNVTKATAVAGVVPGDGLGNYNVYILPHTKENDTFVRDHFDMLTGIHADGGGDVEGDGNTTEATKVAAARLMVDAELMDSSSAIGSCYCIAHLVMKEDSSLNALRNGKK